jgi:hypothetical protein
MFQRRLLLPSSGLSSYHRSEAVSISETSLSIYQTTRLSIPEDSHLNRLLVAARSCKSPRWSSVIVLPIRPKSRRFESGRGDGFLMAIKFRSTPSFGGEVKPEAACCSACKNHSQVWTEILFKVKFIITFAYPSWLVPDDSGGRIARELWGTNQKSSVGIILLWFFHADVPPGGWTIGPLMAAVQRHNLTLSTSSSSSSWTWTLRYTVIFCAQSKKGKWEENGVEEDKNIFIMNVRLNRIDPV